MIHMDEDHRGLINGTCRWCQRHKHEKWCPRPQLDELRSPDYHENFVRLCLNEYQLSHLKWLFDQVKSVANTGDWFGELKYMLDALRVTSNYGKESHDIFPNLDNM